MTALFNLTSQYLELAHKLYDGDFDAQTIADTIEASGITDEISVKAQGIEMVARETVQSIPAIDAEIDRLKALKAHREHVAEGLRRYLLSNMQSMQIERIDCPLFTFSIRKKPPTVDVFDEDMLPAEFMKAPEPKPPAPDKKALAAAIKAGREIAGARIVQGVRLAVS